MGEVEKIVGGFRSASSDLLVLVPEFKAVQAKLDNLSERVDRLDQRLVERIGKVEERLDKHDEKFEKIFITLERHNEKFERIFTTLEKHNQILENHSEKLERNFETLNRFEMTQQTILHRLDYAERNLRAGNSFREVRAFGQKGELILTQSGRNYGD